MPEFIKLNRNKRFNFKTRYYDADKEELENRIAVIKSEMKHEAGMQNSEITRYKMSKEWKLNRTRQGHFNKSNLRISLIAGILIIFFYYYLYL